MNERGKKELVEVDATPKILYVTALYDVQKYCQSERVDAFNAVYEECKKHGLSMLVMTVINNSKESFKPWMEKLHEKRAKFPYIIKDIGERHYLMDAEDRVKAYVVNPETGEASEAEEYNVFKEAGLTKFEQFDIYRLMAEVLNDAFDFATENGFEYMSIQSGDQILPKDQPIIMTEFLKAHPQCGLVNGLLYFDYSKGTTVVDGVERESYRPMVRFQNPEHTRWLHANMLPTKEHGGMELCEVDMIGTGGSLIPRSVFANKEFRFNTKWTGLGEDLAFCVLLKTKGLKVYILPWFKIPNRYPNGDFY
jgi:hypothetical protein